MVPDNLRYTEQHEWVLVTAPDTVRVGITDFAQSQLGEVVYVQLLPVGEAVVAGQPVGEVESVKSVSEVFAPVTGEVVARNDALDSSSELVNSDPYGAGWMIEIKLAEASAVDSLLDAAQYRTLIGEA